MPAEVTYCEHDLPYFICGACAWRPNDPLRPPATDEEPWQIAVADLEPFQPSLAWLGFAACAFVIGIAVGRLLP